MPNAYLKALKEILWPSVCFLCEKKISDSWLCGDCLEKIEFLYPPLCRLCSTPMGANQALCQKCRKTTPSYDRMVAITSYKEPMIRLIHLFKYKNYDYFGEFFSSLMIKQLEKIGFNFWGYDLFTSVPMHPLKLKARGYNQAEILAKFLAKYFQIPYKYDIIYERIMRPSQTKIQTSQRQENIKDAFIVKKDCPDKKIILVDDIFTTGATVEACAKALKAKGAQNITVIVLSKAK